MPAPCRRHPPCVAVGYVDGVRQLRLIVAGGFGGGVCIITPRCPGVLAAAQAPGDRKRLAPPATGA